MLKKWMPKLKEKIKKWIQELKEMDPDVRCNAVLWVVGAVFSSILPILVMVGNYVAYNCKGSILDFYTGYTDGVVFLFAVTISLLLLCFDTDKRIDKKARNKGLIYSLIVMSFCIIVYANKTKQKSIDDSELRQIIEKMSETKKISENIDFQRVLAMWDEPPILVHFLTYLVIIFMICTGWNILTKHVHSNSDNIENREGASNGNTESK